MAEVLIWDGVTKHTLPAERILSSAIDADMDVAIVIGTDKDGEFYFASTHADGGEVLWWIEKAKQKLLNMGEQ